MIVQKGVIEPVYRAIPGVGQKVLRDAVKLLLEEYDEVVFIPMSSGLSGACESATVFAADYDGRVQVVNNQRISVTQYLSCLDAMKMAEDGHDAVYIKNRLEETKF